MPTATSCAQPVRTPVVEDCDDALELVLDPRALARERGSQPMLTFWIVAALLIVAALAFVLVPLLRPRTRSAPSLREANLAVLRGQRRDIENDVSLGLLPKEAREAALAELAARAEEDLGGAAEAPAGPARKPWAVAAFFGLLIPAVAVGFYLWVGTPEATDPRVMAAAAAKPGDHQIEEMIVLLEQKM